MELKNSFTIMQFMNPNIQNIFQNFKQTKSKEEIFTTLLEHKNIKVELINSNFIENGEIYIQEQDEWVIILQGKAILEIEKIPHTLKSGDYLFIPAKTEHRVLFTNEKTLWLAIHIF